LAIGVFSDSSLTLAALLWGERHDHRARAGLRQALLALRKALAVADPALLRVEGQTLALDPVGVDVDVAMFEGWLADGAPEALAHVTELLTVVNAGQLCHRPGPRTKHARPEGALQTTRAQRRWSVRKSASGARVASHRIAANQSAAAPPLRSTRKPARTGTIRHAPVIDRVEEPEARAPTRRRQCIAGKSHDACGGGDENPHERAPQERRPA
jgi:hypothetical protein